MLHFQNLLKFLSYQNNIIKDHIIQKYIPHTICYVGHFLVLNGIIDETEFLYINAVILVQMNKKKLINEIRMVFYGILLFTSYFTNVELQSRTLPNLLYLVNTQILQKISNHIAEHSHILGDIIFDFTLYRGLNINYDITEDFINMITSSRGFIAFSNMIKENIFVEGGNKFMDKRPCYYN